MTEGNDSKYIHQLKTALSLDPGSKLFLSFAEELRKHDHPEDAILTLQDGLKKRPDYAAAHLTLGRWYMYMDMMPEAARELKLVPYESPFALYAHKRLDLLNLKSEYAWESVPEPALTLPESATAEEDIVYMPETVSDVVISEGPYRETTLSEIPQIEITGPAAAPGFRSVREGIEEAGKYLSDGLNRAMEIYDELLLVFPGDPVVLRKKEELTAVMRMLGQDREAIVRRLDLFLSAVHAGFGQVGNERDIVLGRLNSFLERVQLRFYAAGNKKTVLERLKKFSESLHAHFPAKAEQHDTVNRMQSFSDAVKAHFAEVSVLSTPALPA
jgi:tetratricopeptide (TPR) repeat protein